MTDDAPRAYVLNRNAGADRLHCNPGERCNTDDAEDRWTLDEATALKMKAGGTDACEHCIGNWPKDGGVTL